MIWLVVGIVVLGLLLLITYGLVRTDPSTLARILRTITVVVLGVAIVVLTVSGRLALAAPLIPFLLWFVGWRRNPFAAAGRWGGQRAQRSSGNPSGSAASSDIETPWFSMSLDHDSGLMTGRILQGSFAGKMLDDLSLPELLSLRERIITDNDVDSLSLLEAWLDRAYGADWRHEKTRETGDDGMHGAPSSMTQEEALAVLGLVAGASENDIRTAHRRLMLKAHPDQGGTAYLAARINQARDILLGEGR
ncbi:MAG: hypothetical protein V6Z81_05815 [Parvularculales bacterium]